MRIFLLVLSVVLSRYAFGGGDVVRVSNELRSISLRSEIFEVVTKVDVKDGWSIYGPDAIQEMPTRFNWAIGGVDIDCEIVWPASDSNHHLPQSFEIKSIFRNLNKANYSLMNGTLSWLACKSDKCLPGKSEFQVDCSKIVNIEPEERNARGSMTIFALIAGAFIGGFLLNLMPCIFPVLGIKIFRILQSNELDRKSYKIHSIAYTFGIICTFLALGAVLIAFRSLGHKLGWGFQLQNVPFLIFLSYLMIVFGLNLLGMFELNIQFSSKTGKKAPLIENFLEGFFVTILSTPCSAPFMGASIGFALTQPSQYTIAILVAMGLGLALPFQLLAFFPALSKLLPKTGAWMDKLKQLLAFPLFGTAIWLLWLLHKRSSDEVLFLTIIGGLIIFFAVWMFSVSREACKKHWISTRYAALALLFATAWILPYQYYRNFYNKDHAQHKTTTSGFWKTFSETEILARQENGQAVFVDVTADWCLTCKANEQLVLASEDVKLLFNKYNVYPMKADWTAQDEYITEFLEKFGVAGVPLYVFFPPAKNSTPIILPNILTQSKVIETVKSYCNSK